MFENFEKTMGKFQSSLGLLFGSVFLVGGGSGLFLVNDLVTEDWDNTPTALTETVSENFRSNVKEMTSIQAEQGILAKRQDIFEHDTPVADLERRSTEWVDYKKQEDVFAQQNEALSQELKGKQQSFFDAVMTNPDLTEKGWAELVTSFEAADLGKNVFPDTNSAYVLKECQLDSNAMAADARADFTKSCVSGESKGDTNRTIVAGFGGGALLTLALIMGGAANAERVQSAARRRRSRKQQKKPTN